MPATIAIRAAGPAVRRKQRRRGPAVARQDVQPGRADHAQGRAVVTLAAWHATHVPEHLASLLHLGLQAAAMALRAVERLAQELLVGLGPAQHDRVHGERQLWC
eukprot:350255-Chlamydomonas_euryale.AAC.15